MCLPGASERDLSGALSCPSGVDYFQDALHARLLLSPPGVKVEFTSSNKELFDRFKIEQLPAIVLFRKGKMYTKVMESPDGHGHDKDKDKVIAFATDGFSAVQAVDVPKEKGFVDKLVDKVASASSFVCVSMLF